MSQCSRIVLSQGHGWTGSSDGLVSLALCPDDAKQDPVVYGAEFGALFLAEGPRTASIQKGLDYLGIYHSGLEGQSALLYQY